MTDQLISSRVEVDATQAVPALDSVAAGVAKVSQAERQGASATAAAVAAEKDRAAGLGASGAELPKVANEELNLSRVRAAVQKQSMAQIREETAARKRLADEATAGLRRTGSATQQLGVQAGDFFQQLSLGTPFFTAFGQQAQQAAGAAAQMEGRAASVGRFLMGPWGIALTVATTLLGNLAVQMLTTGEAAVKQRDRAKELADALNELSRASGSARRSAEDEMRVRVAAAQRLINETIETRQNTKAKLENARATIEQANAALSQDFGNPVAGRRLADAAARTESLTKQIADQDREIAGAQRRVKVEQEWFRAVRASAAATDVAAAASQRYERIEARLQAEVMSGNMTAVEAARELTSAKRQEEASVAAAAAAKRSSTSAARDMAKADREVAKALDEVAEAANRAMTALERDVNSRSFEEELAAAQRSSRQSNEEFFAKAGEQLGGSIADGARDGVRQFRDEGLVAAEAIGQSLGGSAGRALRTAAGTIDGVQTGDYTAIGGRTGGLLTLSSSLLGNGGLTDAQKRLTGYENTPSMRDGMPRETGDAVRDAIKPLRDTFSKVSSTQLGQGTIGGAASSAAAGYGIASAFSEALGIGGRGGAALKGAGAGAGFGMQVGGPIGAAVGAAVGGLIGALSFKIRKGSASVSSDGGSIAVGDAVGNSAGLRKAAGQMGNSVSDGLEALVAQLGGDIGAFNVSLGRRNKSFVVDGTGGNRTKGAGVQKFKDEGEAVQAALADAIRDGAVGNVSPRVQAVLREYADNLNKGVAEALKVKGLEDLLANDKNPFATVFRDFDFQAKQRRDTAAKYGFDLVEIERITAEERARLFKDTVERSTASVKAVLDELRFGSRATGTAIDRRTALSAEFDRQASAARGGDQAAIDKVAQLSQQLDDLDREVFGTAGGAPGSRANTMRVLEELVSLSERRINDAAAAAKAPDNAAAAKLETTNTQLDEANDQLSELVAGMRRLVGATEAGLGYTPAAPAGINPGARVGGGRLERGVGGAAR